MTRIAPNLLPETVARCLRKRQWNVSLRLKARSAESVELNVSVEADGRQAAHERNDHEAICAVGVSSRGVCKHAIGEATQDGTCPRWIALVFVENQQPNAAL